MEEVLDFLDDDDDLDEPICDGSDDDLGMLELDDRDDSDLEGQRQLGQRKQKQVLHVIHVRVDCTKSSQSSL